ncbi:MAG: HD domain-containing protein [Thermotogaceae bacterium]|nr:HD domain-containing protein [Thermotogaceae bacterium]
MKDMLEIVWKYLAFRVGSVTVVGTSGEWDPLMIAFLGDLLSEREIPLLVVDRYPKGKKNEDDEKERRFTYIIKELVDTKVHDAMALGVEADQFMKDLTMNLKERQKSQDNKDAIERKRTSVDDQYWQNEIKEAIENSSRTELLNFMNNIFTLKFSELEDDVRIKVENKGIDKFSQLGLKSYWMGIKDPKARKRYHTRYHHSIGVMEVGTYLYDNAINNAGLKKNPFEKQFLRLAALLHDIGHLPFSHLIEDVFNELNWKPVGYKNHYSHVFQTDKEIEELFNDNGQHLKKQLEETGYNVTDVIKLVNGSFGVGYLDAIINSSIDADKIDYVFRDTYSTGRKTSLVPVQFLKDIVNGLSITPEKYLSFSGVSAMAAVGLLRERQRLYRSLYLQPGIVVLEGIVKLIIKTYFVHLIKLDDMEIIEKMKLSDYDYPDLGDYKISYCMKKLKEIFEEVTKNGDGTNLEIETVRFMFEEITDKKYKNVLSTEFLENIKECFETIEKIKSEEDLKKLEQKVTHKGLKGQKEKIQGIARDVMFRMPANTIIEVIKPPRFLSSAENRKERERSDGTKTFSECIIVPKNDYNAWNTSDKAAITIHDSRLNDKKDKRDEKISVYMYPLSGNPDNIYYSTFAPHFRTFQRAGESYNLSY